jgi:hypothetical protein
MIHEPSRAIGIFRKTLSHKEIWRIQGPASFGVYRHQARRCDGISDGMGLAQLLAEMVIPSSRKSQPAAKNSPEAPVAHGASPTG